MSNRIDETLKKLRKAHTPALGPFMTVGFPTVELSERLAQTILESGGDFIELAVPFSDPLADGPTIQKTSLVALKQGANVATVLEVVRNLRSRGVEAPLILMGYMNPYLRYGLERFIEDSARSGVDGFIIPDLPTEESETVRVLCDKHDLCLIPLLAPTSTDERIQDACQHARGFIYCVSLRGVTGARTSLSEGLAGFVARVRKHTDLPIMVGFGISSREHIEEISAFADGAIVASALLDAIGRAAPGTEIEVAKSFIKSLKGN